MIKKNITAKYLLRLFMASPLLFLYAPVLMSLHSLPGAGLEASGFDSNQLFQVLRSRCEAFILA
jgi:hypothetical protein